MAIDIISNYVAGSTMNSVAKNTTNKTDTSKTDTSKTQNTKTKSSKNQSSGSSGSSKTNSTSASKQSNGVIYEKGTTNNVSTNSDYKTQNSALIAKLKADSDNRISQLKGIVEQMMHKQGTAIGNADSMWKFLADGNFSVDAATKAQAQADIAEDGYWGVDKTSDRIVDFAKALSGGDSSKAGTLLNAFKKGFQEATKSWGKSLPDISQRTYDAVIKKFDTWVSGTESISDNSENE